MTQSGIVTFLFTDLIRATEHLQRIGDEADQRPLNSHHRLMTRAITANSGQELKWLGHGILAAFTPDADAVRSAIIAQQLCALQSRYGEAHEWFAQARTALDDQGARPLRAITDFDESLMHQSRSDLDGRSRAKPLFDSAVELFRTLGMSGLSRRAERLALGN